MQRVLFVLCAVLILLPRCNVEDPTSPPVTSNSGELTKVRIMGSLEDLEVGVPVSFGADYDYSGKVKESDISWSWTLQRNDSLLKSMADRSFAEWTPRESGRYVLTVNALYEGRTTTATVYLIVIERVVYVDTNLSALLATYRERLPGTYVGTISTPWTTDYRVAMVFREDGTYCAYNTEYDGLSALYYGTDNDDPKKRWELTDIRSDATAKGSLVIFFEGGTTTIDEIRGVRFSTDADTLSFSMWHLNQYGPVEARLVRIDPSQIPPRPLPTPRIDLNGSQSIDNWVGPVSVRISTEPNLHIVYTILPLTSSIPVNPMPLWNEYSEVVGYSTPFVINGAATILARSTDGSRMSGVAVVQVRR